jgi:hypothetical protein
MKILFLYDSLRLGGGTWNRSAAVCAALERDHRLVYAYQVVDQKSWDATHDDRLKAELIGSQQFEDAGFDCLIMDGRTHEDADFPRVPMDVLREFSRSGGATIFLFSDVSRLVDGSIRVEHVNEVTGAAGLIHTLFTHPSGSIVRGYASAGHGGPFDVKVDHSYLAQVQKQVADRCYVDVDSLRLSDPLYLEPVFDRLCVGGPDTLWVSMDDMLVDTIRSAPPAFASILRRDGLAVFMTGNLWRDHLAEEASANVTFLRNLVRFAEHYQRERGRRPPRPGVFISYSHADRETALVISRALEERGADIWLDEQVMGFGSGISESCVTGIGTSDKVVMLITPQSLQSEWVRFELEAAISAMKETGRRELIVPVVVGVDHRAVVASLPEIRDIKYLALDPPVTSLDVSVVTSLLA